MTPEEIVRGLADADPMDHDDMGSTCIFCGAIATYYGEPYADCYHREGCTWAAARRHCGLPVAMADAEPGRIHGPPKHVSLMSPTERMLYEMQQRMIEQLKRPLFFDRAAEAPQGEPKQALDGTWRYATIPIRVGR